MNKLLHAILLLLTIMVYQAITASTVPGQSSSGSPVSQSTPTPTELMLN